MEIKVKRLRKNALLPLRATAGSAGADLYACLDAPLTLAPGARALVPTGIALELAGANLVAFVFARSGLAIRHGISLSNGVGVIDSDYRGELQVGLVNLSDKPFVIENRMRIAQLVVSECVQAEFVEVGTLDETARGEGGFGSTGLHEKEERI